MNARKALYKFYSRIQEAIAPTLKYSQYLYEDVLKAHVHPDTRWLDLGCGHQILPEWRSEDEKRLVEKCKMIVGIDYDLQSLKNHKNIPHKVRGDISRLPFRNNFFDMATANMVVEHLDRPEIQFKEVCRTLRPGGLFILHTPNVSGYTTILARLVPHILRDKLIYFFQGRKEEDVFDTYYRANSRNEIINLAKTTGFDVLKIKMIVSSAQFIIIPPIVIFELIFIRLLMTKPLKPLRTGIIAILKKQMNTVEKTE